MQNIVVFCQRDWLHPRAGAVEHYLREVCRRMTAHGALISWIAQTHPRTPFRPRRPRSEQVDDIQIARLGPALLYRKMACLFLAALAQKFDRKKHPTIILECVSGRPLNLASVTSHTVIPIVFHLAPTGTAPLRFPRPLIAATDEARHTLLDLGIERKFIISAPFGAPEPVLPADTRTGPPVLAVAGRIPRTLRAALRLLRRKGVPWRPVPWSHRDTDRGKILSKAMAAYCGPGLEYFAPECAAYGLPVFLSPERAPGNLIEVETGFLIRGPAQALAERLESLAVDPPYRNRLVSNCIDFARTRSWNTTAGLVLAAIENLQYEAKHVRPAQVRHRQQIPV